MKVKIEYYALITPLPPYFLFSMRTLTYLSTLGVKDITIYLHNDLGKSKPTHTFAAGAEGATLLAPAWTLLDATPVHK